MATQAAVLEIKQSFFVEAFVILVFAVSQLCLVANPMLGTYVLTFSIVAFAWAALALQHLRKLFVSLCIFLATQHASIALNVQGAFTRVMAFYAVILLLAVAYRYLFIVTPEVKTSLRPFKYLLLVLLMVVAGAVLGGLGYKAIGKAGFNFMPVPRSLLFLALPVWAFAEEMLFRGLIQHHALKSLRPEFAMVISCGVYALAYASGGLRAVLFALLTGAVFTFVYYKTNNVLLTTVLNFATKLAFVLLALNIVR